MPEIRKDLKPFEALGYRFIGYDGSTHYVLEHPEAGRIRVSLTPSRQNTHMHELAAAKRKIIHGRATAEGFLDWLWEHEQIPRDGSKRIKGDLPYMVDRWLKANDVRRPNSAIPMGSTSIIRWCTSNGFIVVEHQAIPGRAGRKEGVPLENGRYLVRGRDWNVSIERPEALKNGNGRKRNAPPPVMSEVPAEFAAKAKETNGKSAGLEVAPGVFVDASKLPAPPLVAAQPSPALTDIQQSPNPESAAPATTNGITNVVTVNAQEFFELRQMVFQLTSAVLPDQIEKREMARDALDRAERTLVAAIGAMNDALGEIRACRELINAEASMTTEPLAVAS